MSYRRITLRSLSTSSATSSSNSTPNPTTVIASNEGGGAFKSSPKWLDRWFEVWYEESGTREILQLKEQVQESSAKFDETQRNVTQARGDLDQALKAWEDSQRQHTRLLQVRDSWTNEQAQEFAGLVQKEIEVRNNLEEAKQMLVKRETELSKSQLAYMDQLRRRYHEEQIWQDKWRVLSTFGTWGLIVLNSAVFLISQYVNRQRETQRLRDMQELLKQTLSTNTSTLQAIQDRQDHQQQESMDLRKQMESSKQNTETTKIEAVDTQPVSEDPNEEVGDEIETNNITTSNLSVGLMKAKSVIRSSQRATLEWLRSFRYKSKPLSERVAAVSDRARITTLVGSLSERALSISKNVDIPSALLGASITGVAWIMAVTVSSKHNGR